MFSVVVLYEDGAAKALLHEPLDLAEAAELTIVAADELGTAYRSNGHGAPVVVQLMSGDDMLMSLRIMEGGLRSGSVAQGRIPKLM